MVTKIKLVQGDTKPALVCSITDEITGAAINITGATVLLKFRAAGATTLTATVTGSVTNGATGEVAFYPASAPTMLLGEAGDYEGEIQITFSDGSIQTVYDLLKFKLREDF
jgi:hypothetical protein